ncbi:MAG: hypothetical protein JW798_07385 [Prolixibacteraceae bacterium]|nr:hypothetical protein [Prolixibacteraceae bacterium]
MIRILLTLALALLTGFLSGQNYQKVAISYEKIGDGLYDFYVENPNHYPVQLHFRFTEFENMMASVELPVNRTVEHGKHMLLNIRRIYLDIPGSFKYTFQTRVGAYPVNYDEKTVYRLPVEKGDTTKIIFLSAPADDQNRITKVFSFHKGDTVFTCREGIVCMKTEAEYREGYRTGLNSVTLLHPDRSFGKYEVFADSQLFINLGDTIAIGRPLGIAGGSNYSIGPHCRFSVYYVNAPIDSILDNKLRQYHTYVDPLFKTSENEAEILEPEKEYTF